MRTVFVTGGTGLIGSNICKQLIERGDHVRAIARPGSETGPLRDLGVTIVEGDITDAARVAKAAEGCDGVIHSAAVLGGPNQDIDEHKRVNTGGVANVLDAAQLAGIQRVVTLGTTTYFEFKTSPLTETSPFDPHAAEDPYTVTKGAAFLEAMKRAQAGLDVSVVIPGGTFGPAPTINRAMEAPSFNLRIVWALQGKFDAAVSFPIPWSLASDVAYASIAALDRGVRGEKYLAFAGSGEVSTMAAFCNRACEIAGVPHRVNEITAADLDASEEVRRRVGPSLIALAHQRFPEPYFINQTTVERLDYHPRPLDDSLRETVQWLYDHDLVS
ncbi:MAG: NAD-dependent epimerase/dehydratase family protein [Actinobacteria bacterium]|nr:MAG: NAD-dependent epimerase/dehydratase family protein [Actinomycetota bacterium]